MVRRGPPVNQRAVWPGNPFPLGPRWDGHGTNFSLFSENAEAVELCLFDEEGNEERVQVSDRTAFNWHCYLPGVGPGQRYGYRVHGRYDPANGLRFNPAKLLIDPYAKAIEGEVDWNAANTLPYVPTGSDDADLEIDEDDSSEAIPRSIVIDESFDWEGDRSPRTRWNDTVIYEVHVKGFTKLREQVPEHLRGTYAGLASDEAIAYFKDLGVTAVELLPIHHIVDEQFLAEKGLSNYWGYSSIGYLAPHALYSASGRRGEQVREFKGMVKALHREGIEVILDVVYNHTAEGNHLGPMLSFKGVDNTSYYRLVPDDPRFYMDFTGTGNSLNPVHPSVLRLIMDSLRYFVVECHVDGFRFDLASALAREFYDVDRLSAFFDTIHQDPVLSQVKLIAEPWDVGPGGYQVGNFPVLWMEWNGLYRDVVRDFWRGQANVAQFAQRFTGSADLYQSDGRRPFASINFVTAHDGFTLRDLVSYNEKHNEANMEDNRDGTDDNRSWNCGVEGETDDPAVKELRNFITTLLLSQGVPMIVGGDEFARTQFGNNNAWCQDNELSWFDWDWDDRQRRMYEFAKRLIALRQNHPVFRRRDFLVGAEMGSGLPDVWWFRPDGRRMTQKDWGRSDAHALGVFLNGQEIPTRTPEGDPVADHSFVLLLNAHHEPIEFTLPARRFGLRWVTELSTAEPDGEPAVLPPRAKVVVESRSLVVLRREF
jgi:isoamylase